MTGLMPSDLKRWAAGYLRDALAAYGVDVNVATRTPKTIRYPLAKPLLIVDELTPTRYDLTQWDQELSVSATTSRAWCAGSSPTPASAWPTAARSAAAKPPTAPTRSTIRPTWPETT